MEAKRILLWYDQNKRSLPWRTHPPNLYKVLVSEFMLQQTTVSSVIPYFYRFMEKFPTLETLANAHIDEILLLWQGLGYYRRAFYLHQCAGLLVNQPIESVKWIELPGIGPYMASAIEAIVFEQKRAVVDGNMTRIMSRYGGISGTGWKEKVYEQAKQMLPQDHYGDYAQALMDLGALVCRPQKPLCHQCPLQEKCYARHTQEFHLFPPKALRKSQKKYTHIYVIQEQENVWISQSHGLLRGLWGFPSTMWAEAPYQCPLSLDSLQKKGEIRHIFTHIDLYADIWQCFSKDIPESLGEGQWVSQKLLFQWPFSRLMRKVQHVAGLS